MKWNLKKAKIPHTVLETTLVFQLIQELQIKSKTEMSWSSAVLNLYFSFKAWGCT